MKQKIWCGLWFFGLGGFGLTPAIANPSPIALSYVDRPLEVNLLNNPDLVRSRNDVISGDTISLSHLTFPSLWWTREQLPNKLVLNWLAYPEQKHIDVIVNPQFWNILDYPERYQLVNRWGTVGRKHGFNIRIFNLRFSERQPIVAYTCSHVPADQRCIVQWQSLNQNSLGVKSVGR